MPGSIKSILGLSAANELLFLADNLNSNLLIMLISASTLNVGK